MTIKLNLKIYQEVTRNIKSDDNKQKNYIISYKNKYMRIGHHFRYGLERDWTV